ncbi:MAG: divalent-cation tolerance protein CutA [Promethearchaeota archaeon]
MNEYIFFVTVGKIDEGKKIAKILVEEKIVACVNIIHNISSIYRWKDNIEEDIEFLLIIKTTEENSDLLIKKIKDLHSYKEPECIGFKIEKGSESYLKWIRDVVK